MIDPSLKRVNRMDVKLCPKCKELPKVEIRNRLLRYECVVHCNTLGCNLYWPQITTGFNKDAVMKKAAIKWNKSVDELEMKI